MLKSERWAGPATLYSTNADGPLRHQALSELTKSITALPTENTLVSLPPGPVLELICVAAQRQTTAIWLSLATMLTAQLNPPSFSTIRALPDDILIRDARSVVERSASILVEATLTFLASPGAMETVSKLVESKNLR